VDRAKLQEIRTVGAEQAAELSGIIDTPIAPAASSTTVPALESLRRLRSRATTTASRLGLLGQTVTVTARLGELHGEILSAAGRRVARRRRAPAAAGQQLRSAEPARLLEQAVLDACTTDKPWRRKGNPAVRRPRARAGRSAARATTAARSSATRWAPLIAPSTEAREGPRASRLGTPFRYSRVPSRPSTSQYPSYYQEFSRRPGLDSNQRPAD
jgi:hypothetical protein